MKIVINNNQICDDSRECDGDTLFLSDELSKRYKKDANRCKAIITKEELDSYFTFDNIKIIALPAQMAKQRHLQLYTHFYWIWGIV